MARACPGKCEEHLTDSKVRGRRTYEGVISADVARDILQLAASSAMVTGDGYGGRKRPLSMREVFSGLRPIRAAHWAISQPSAGGQQAAAVRWVRAFLNAAAQMLKKVGNTGEVSGDLLLDGIHLACRSAAQKPRGDDEEAEDLFHVQNLPISAGSDLLVDTMTIAEARAKCLALDDCAGCTFEDAPTNKPVLVYFKSKQELYGGSHGWTSYLRRRQPEIPDSHPPHADNCYRHGRDCMASRPRQFWRTRSATLFLHGPESGDFSGGDFFYSSTWETPIDERLRVTPQVGRMVSFDSGAANIHGVEEVKQGTRCSISAWYTTDPTRAAASKDLEIAEALLSGI